MPERIRPIEDWLQPQERFRHLFAPEARGTLREIQRQVDEQWADLVRRCER
jgi:pyruvate ferredoxin oxidoreductase beta subunit